MERRKCSSFTATMIESGSTKFSKMAICNSEGRLKALLRWTTSGTHLMDLSTLLAVNMLGDSSGIRSSRVTGFSANLRVKTLFQVTNCLWEARSWNCCQTRTKWNKFISMTGQNSPWRPSSSVGARIFSLARQITNSWPARNNKTALFIEKWYNLYLIRLLVI